MTPAGIVPPPNCVIAAPGLVAQRSLVQALPAALPHYVASPPAQEHADKAPATRDASKKAFQIDDLEGFDQWLVGRRDWTRTNDPHHVKVVL